jgi:hypothetical protein
LLMATLGRNLHLTESKDALKPKSKMVFNNRRTKFDDYRVKPIMLSLEGIIRHSGNSIDETQSETPLFNKNALSVDTNDSIQAMEFIL